MNGNGESDFRHRIDEAFHYPAESEAVKMPFININRRLAISPRRRRHASAQRFNYITQKSLLLLYYFIFYCVARNLIDRFHLFIAALQIFACVCADESRE